MGNAAEGGGEDRCCENADQSAVQSGLTVEERMPEAPVQGRRLEEERTAPEYLDGPLRFSLSFAPFDLPFAPEIT